jgi:uncharacterized phage-associated protein
MSYDPRAIANYLLDRASAEKSPLTPMKIQKLVYYAHGWHLAIKDQPLINEQVEAWTFGPVIPSLYRTFRAFGDQPILPLSQPGAEWVVPSYPPYSTLSPTIEDDPRRAPFTKALLDKIWEVYGGYTAAQLSNATHAAGTPWDRVFHRYQGQIPKRTDIPTEWIEDYFARLRRGEAQPQ